LKYLPADNAREQLAELAAMPTYTVQLLPKNAEEEMKWEDNVLYVKKVEVTKEDKTQEMMLEYRVKTPKGEIKSGTISEQELGQYIEKRATEKKKEKPAAPILTEAELREKELNEFESRLAAILIVTTGRNHTIGHGSQFDARPILKAYKIYMDAYNAMNTAARFNWNQLDKLWLEVAWQQRYLPASWWNEFCRRDRSFDPTPKFNDTQLPRTLLLYNDCLFLPLESFSGLGFDFGLIRGVGAGGGAVADGVRGRLNSGRRRDSAALGRLCEVRNTEAEQLYQRLNPNLAPRPR
jgi:hypothetical protein